MTAKRAKRSEPASGDPLVHLKCQLAGEAWTYLFGPVPWGRFIKAIRPLFVAGEKLGRVERAMQAYREAHQDRPISLEWFVGDYRRWATRADASPLDEWTGFAAAAGITDVEAYQAQWKQRLLDKDAAREPLAPRSSLDDDAQPSLLAG